VLSPKLHRLRTPEEKFKAQSSIVFLNITPRMFASVYTRIVIFCTFHEFSVFAKVKQVKLFSVFTIGAYGADIHKGIPFMTGA
jgi:hypothetical protein